VVDFLVSARAADVSLFYYYVLSKEVWPIAGVQVQYPVSANRDFAADLLTSDVVVLEMNVATIGGITFAPSWMTPCCTSLTSSRMPLT
jgi:hypothetical protein